MQAADRGRRQVGDGPDASGAKVKSHQFAKNAVRSHRNLFIRLVGPGCNAGANTVDEFSPDIIQLMAPSQVQTVRRKFDGVGCFGI